MAIQFRRGKEDDLVSENLLTGEPAYCTDTHKLLISRGNGVNDLIVRESEVDAKVESEVSAVLDEHLADAIATATERKLLWSGTLTAGNTVTLSDDLSKYRQVFFRMNDSVTVFTATIQEGISAVRANGTFAKDGVLEIGGITGTYSDNNFTFERYTGFNISTSGIVAITLLTTITEIWGLK